MPIKITGTKVAGSGTAPPLVHPAEWSDTNLPWAATAGAAPWLTNLGIPAGIPIVPLAGSGTNFKTRLDATVAGQAGPFVVQLEAGVYEFPAFYKIGAGTGTNQEYTAYWDGSRKLAGLVGRGADVTFVQVAPDSMPQACLDYMALLATGPTGAVSQVSALRIDLTTAHGFYVGGITFRGQDQNDTIFHSSLTTAGVYQPQPAPYIGLRPYSADTNVTRLSHCRFQAFGRTVNSMPPFECPQFGTQYGDVKIWSCEFDGRLSATFNANRPRRSTFFMGNNEASHQVWDTWAHHSNISRYAVNDGNRVTFGTYRLERCKFEQVTNTRNSGDPAYNGGNSLGGWTDASDLGWESCAATINVVDCILCMDNSNPHDANGDPMHFQHTHVQGPTTSGGRMYVTGTEFRSSGQPALEGWALMRLHNATAFYIDGAVNTIFIYHPKTGVRLTMHTPPGSWPPNPTGFPVGVTSATHYIAKIV